MKEINKQITVDGDVVTTHIGIIVTDNNITYASLILSAMTVGITKRDVDYDHDIQEITFNKNNKKLKVNADSVIIDNKVVGSYGFVEFMGTKYVPFQCLIESFNGTYFEDDIEITISNI